VDSNTLNIRLLNLGLKVPDLLLPRDSIDLSAWAVIACDQFTQDPAYWERAGKAAGDRASTLNLIFPEARLAAVSGQAGGGEGGENRIAAIHRTMAAYLGGEVFAPPFTGGVYVERDSPYHKGRRGIVLTVDLDRYDWGAGARTLIRATEGTAPERLPPRMDLRRGAPLETSHVLLLIDDDGDTLLPGLAERLGSARPAYRGNLMLDSGSVTGWRLDQEEQWAFIADQLEALRRRAESRYGDDAGDVGSAGDVSVKGGSAQAKGAGSGGVPPDPFLYAVGDGNHSLAAAKGVWEEYKRAHPGDLALMRHPARFALVEIENLYDRAISFEPIHRIIFNAPPDALLEALAALPGFSLSPLEGPGALDRLCRLVGEAAPKTRLGLIAGPRLALLETSAPGLATVALQPILDRFANAASGGTSIDYIHGAEELIRLTSGGDSGAAAQARTAGILLPPIRKEGLFETVARSGPLPRKSFSMGEAVEKRFYLECRRLC
jgi:hypothetical protein